jgi:hypothetical protein
LLFAGVGKSKSKLNFHFRSTWEVYFTEFEEQYRMEKQELTLADIHATLIVHGIPFREKEHLVQRQLITFLKENVHFSLLPPLPPLLPLRSLLSL